MAGEFLVAGELLRRGIMAAVTYGNAKKADVVAFHEGRSALLEVKSTSEAKWVLGGTLPQESASLWVLVFLPPDVGQAPQYFVLTSAELRNAVAPRHESYRARYLAKHGRDYAAAGVVSVLRKEVDDRHLAAWDKVGRALGMAW
jgi:hypothetical protein